MLARLEVIQKEQVKWHVSDHSEPGMGPKWTSGNHGPSKGQVQGGWKVSITVSAVFAREEEQRVPRRQFTELVPFNSEHGDAVLNQSCSIHHGMASAQYITIHILVLLTT